MNSPEKIYEIDPKNIYLTKKYEIIAGFVQACRFSAFLQVAGKSSQIGKMFENGNILTKNGKYSPLGKCSPKLENFHIQ